MGEPGEGTNKGYEIGVGDTARFGVSHLLLPLQSVLQKVIENTEHKAIMLDPETQSKVRGAGKAPQSNASMGGFYGIPLHPPFLLSTPCSRYTRSMRCCSAGTLWSAVCLMWYSDF